MRYDPVKDHAERKRILSLIKRCEKEQTMSRWQIYEVTTDADGVDCYIKRGELVRCKECKHWDTADGECYAYRGIYFPNADDYCSYGEREGE